MLFLFSLLFTIFSFDLETLKGNKFNLSWVLNVSSNVKILNEEQLQRNLRISFVGIIFMFIYYLLYFVISLFIALRYSGVEFVSEFVEISYPVVLYSSYAIIIVGLVMLVVSLNKFLKSTEDKSQKSIIKQLRNLLIIPLVVKPLTFIFVATSAFAAWGDDAAAHIMWIGADLLAHILLMVPFLYLAFKLRKEKKEAEFKLNIIIPFILLGILCIWLIFYPTSIFLFFGTSYEDPLQYIMVATNAEIHMAVCALGYGIFFVFWKKFKEVLELDIIMK